MTFTRILGLAGLLIVLYAWHLPPFRPAHPQTENAYIRGQLTTVAPQLSGYVAAVEVQDFQPVARGQVIARAQGYVSLPVHASSSGTVVAIGEQPVAHPSGIPARAIVIETDGLDEAAAPSWTPLPDYRQAEPHMLRDIGMEGTRRFERPLPTDRPELWR